MTLEKFNFPYHRISVEYPARGKVLTLGGNWDYTIKPKTPVSKLFRLNFPVMKRFDPDRLLTEFERFFSVKDLEDFYVSHELHTPFIYHHENYGETVVRFDQPLAIPEANKASDGAHVGINIVLRQVSVS